MAERKDASSRVRVAALDHRVKVVALAGVVQEARTRRHRDRPLEHLVRPIFRVRPLDLELGVDEAEAMVVGAAAGSLDVAALAEHVGRRLTSI